jgi:hypothetical protein
MPVTVKILIDLYQTVTSDPSDRAFWAACLIAFFGFLRKSTLLPSRDGLVVGKFIACSDIVNLTLSSFQLIIRHSKTIQFGQRLLTLPYVSCGDTRLCPVRALLTHLGKSPNAAARPLFDFVSNGTVVAFTYSFFIKRLKSGLLATGHNANEISCHSFRRGGATLAHAIGLPAIEIKLKGDWLSNAFEHYDDVSPCSTLATAYALAKGACMISR